VTQVSGITAFTMIPRDTKGRRIKGRGVFNRRHIATAVDGRGRKIVLHATKGWRVER
jgi:hypothetical protein